MISIRAYSECTREHYWQLSEVTVGAILNMPVSRKRKKRGKVVERQKVVVSPDTAQWWTMRIKPSQMKHLKDEPDFEMFVKIGRMINSVLFAQTAATQFLVSGQISYIALRQYRRGLFVLAGYLHESINILRNVEDRHITMESFIPLRNIVHGIEYKQTRAYLREVRNIAGFHLADSVDIEGTKEALGELELTAHVLMGADDTNNTGFYFELSDTLDIALIGKRFKGERDIDEVNEEIHQAVLKTSTEFVKAAISFQLSLARKMDLAEYVYGHGPVEASGD